MVVYKLNKDLTDSRKYYWIKNGSEEGGSFPFKDHFTENRFLYPVDSKIWSQMEWPDLKRKDRRKIIELTSVALDPPGSQALERTAWVPTHSIEIIQV